MQARWLQRDRVREAGWAPRVTSRPDICTARRKWRPARIDRRRGLADRPFGQKARDRGRTALPMSLYGRLREMAGIPSRMNLPAGPGEQCASPYIARRAPRLSPARDPGSGKNERIGSQRVRRDSRVPGYVSETEADRHVAMSSRGRRSANEESSTTSPPRKRCSRPS